MIPERAGSRSLRKCLKILERAAQDPWEAAQSPSGTFPVMRRTGPIRKMAPVLNNAPALSQKSQPIHLMVALSSAHVFQSLNRTFLIFP